MYRTVGESGFALGHNGNLTNTVSLVEQSGMLPGTVSSDSDLIGELVARAYPSEESADGRDLERALAAVLPRLEGAYSLAIMDASHVIGVRDPNGFRPLCLGKLDSGWVIASESPALDIVGAHFVREIDPGEMVVIDAAGIRSLRPFPDRAHLAAAVHGRVRLLRSPRRPALRQGGARRSPSHGRVAGASRRPSTPTW